MGDIEMIKGVLLAWLLCRLKRIFYGEVFVHQVISTLGVYRREEGEETDKYTAMKTITKRDRTINYAGESIAVPHDIEEGGTHPGSIPGSGRLSDR
jgi:hypothetical protein